MEDKKHTVSVIMPTRDRSRFLERAISCVLAQTFTYLEFVIVDDASTDDTESKVRSFSDPRIKYIRLDRPRGASAARNTGIKNSSGDYIAFIDDDDEWMPEKLEKQMHKLLSSSPGTGLVYCGLEIIRGGKVIRRIYPREKGDLRKRLLLGSLVGGTGTALVKKECFDAVGIFDEDLKSCQDWDMWKRISEKYEFEHVPEILERMYLHEGQISSDYSAMIPGRERMIAKHRAELERHPDILVIHLKKIGKMHCLNGTWREAGKWFYDAVRLRPGEIFRIVAWLLFEYPYKRLFTRTRSFKRYRPDDKKRRQ
jgi:glycosyltransferase involved in cell wall biosynthesis